MIGKEQGGGVEREVENLAEEEKTLEGDIIGGKFFVLTVVPGSAAEMAGIQVGDELLRADGEKLAYPTHLSEVVRARGDQETELVVRRDSAEVILHVRPVLDTITNQFRIGINLSQEQQVRKTRPDRTYNCLRIKGIFKDKRGGVVCSLVADIEEGGVEVPVSGSTTETYIVQKLDSLVLYNNDGEPYNVLKRHNTYDVPIFIDRQIGDAHHRKIMLNGKETEVIFIRPLENSGSIRIVLHELNHAKQSRDNRIRAVYNLYGSEREIDEYDKKGYEAIQGTLKRIFSAIPEAKIGFEKDLVKLSEGSDKIKSVNLECNTYFVQEFEFRRCFPKRDESKYYDLIDDVKSYVNPDRATQSDEAENKLFEEISKVMNAMVDDRIIREDKAGEALAKIAEWHQECDKVRKEEEEIVERTRLLAVLSLPTQIVERDAESGMLVELRQIREKRHIDLLSDFVVETGGAMQNTEELEPDNQDPLVQAYQLRMAQRSKRLRRQEKVWAKTDQDPGADIDLLHVQDPTDPTIIRTGVRRHVRDYMNSIAAMPASMRREDSMTGQIEMPRVKNIVENHTIETYLNKYISSIFTEVVEKYGAAGNNKEDFLRFKVGKIIADRLFFLFLPDEQSQALLASFIDKIEQWIQTEVNEYKAYNKLPPIEIGDLFMSRFQQLLVGLFKDEGVYNSDLKQRLLSLGREKEENDKNKQKFLA